MDEALPLSLPATLEPQLLVGVASEAFWKCDFKLPFPFPILVTTFHSFPFALRHHHTSIPTLFCFAFSFCCSTIFTLQFPCKIVRNKSSMQDHDLAHIQQHAD
ncbi:hypothetical protein BJ508DRAFT_414601 [Ascobolus immersus RN42]|uniref:Uncharacterized protein n=1 Tax=Ascobolus immersus RN42 TaxID=1160509 RepID=A0A3N4IBR6_ASCIM|nr:hypothetical protein BJ508DRAFT_414601 [Ascobolus immersus RN42]